MEIPNSSLGSFGNESGNSFLDKIADHYIMKTHSNDLEQKIIREFARYIIDLNLIKASFLVKDRGNGLWEATIEAFLNET